MSVLQVVGGSAYGGGVAVIKDIARAIQGEGLGPITIEASHPEVVSAFAATGFGVQNSGFSSSVLSASDVRAAIRLRKNIRRKNYQVMHSHTTKMGLLARIAAATAGRTAGRERPLIVHTVHGYGFHRFSSRRATSALVQMEKRLGSITDALVVVSAYHGRVTVENEIVDSAKLFVVPNGIDHFDVAMRAARAKENQSDLAEEIAALRRAGVVVLASYGRIARQKGFDLLITALGEIRRRGDSAPRWRLFIAGTGPDELALAQLVKKQNIADSVRFLGFKHDAFWLAQEADITVVPSRYEGMSIALLEALSLGASVVASDNPENIEVAGDHGAAYFACGDPMSLAQVLASTLADPTALDATARYGQERVRRDFTLEATQQLYRDVYRSLLEGRE